MLGHFICAGLGLKAQNGSAITMDDLLPKPPESQEPADPQTVFAFLKGISKATGDKTSGK